MRSKGWNAAGAVMVAAVLGYAVVTVRADSAASNAVPKSSPAVQVSASGKKPNIVVIFGDDIGYWNLGAYTHGMMGRHPASTASPATARSSPTTMGSRAALPAARPSSWGSCPSAQA
jgi:hypothetical protein